MESGPPLTIWSASGGKSYWVCSVFKGSEREKEKETSHSWSTKHWIWACSLWLFYEASLCLSFILKKWWGTSNGFTWTSVWELRDHNRTTALEFPFGKAMHGGSDWETLDVWHGGKNVRWVLSCKTGFMGIILQSTLGQMERILRETLSKSHCSYETFVTKYVTKL